MKAPHKSFIDMPAGRLGDYLMDDQYLSLRNLFPTFKLCAETISNNGGTPETGSKMVAAVLSKLCRQLEEHFEQDEKVLFPYIRQRLAEHKNTGLYDLPVSLRKIKARHLAITRLFTKLRLLTNDYTPLQEKGTGLKLCYAHLFNFEQDMLKHIFLEEHVLLPKLIKENH